MKERTGTRAELHLHTIYSTKDGMMPMRDIAIRAKEMGLSAVAITDHGNVQGFPDAEHASKKYGIKIIYGMECDCIDDLGGNEISFNITLLVKNKTGLKNLYQLISLSHMHNCCEEPPIPKSLLVEHREGLLIGSCCNNGEIINALDNGYDDETLLDAAQFYDYFEIAPRKEKKEINLRISEMAEKLDKPVIATSNARYLTQDYALSHKILRHCFKKLEDKNEWQHFRSTEEMLDNFSYLGEELCYKAVITNTQLLTDMCEEFDLFPDGRHFPDIKDSAINVTALCNEKIHQLYGENPPTEVLDRLQAELDIILPNRYDSIYMLTRALAVHSLSQGYPVGIRGVGGNSFVSFLLGITDFNPLPPHKRCSCGYADFINNNTVCLICGKDMMADGFDLPYEAFLGLAEDPKVPDFDLDIPKNCWKSTEKLLKDMFGEDRIFYTGVTKCLYESVARQMVRTYASDKNIPFSRNEIERIAEQLTGIRIKDDFHISGHVIIPRNMEVTDFCPIQHCNGRPTVTTQFEYHYMMHVLYKADLFIDKNFDLLQGFAEDTGVDWRSIPLDDEETFELIRSGDVDGIPELHTEYARRMVKDLQPVNFDDLVRIVCFGHDSDAWRDNAELLISNGISLKDTISSREDVMLYLLDKGMDRKLAYRIMEKVRKGMGLSSQHEDAMRDLEVPEWYIESCNKVRYLFPKAHCISSVLFAYRMAWYRAHFPEMYTKPIYVRI